MEYAKQLRLPCYIAYEPYEDVLCVDDAWEIEIKGDVLKASCCMDNFELFSMIQEIGVPVTAVSKYYSSYEYWKVNENPDKSWSFTLDHVDRPTATWYQDFLDKWKNKPEGLK
jgi:hypothetical protein